MSFKIDDVLLSYGGVSSLIKIIYDVIIAIFITF